MLCSEFDTRMHMLLDERKAPEQDPVLLSHACSCAECYAKLETLSRLLDALDLLEPPDLPAEFAKRIVDAVSQGAVSVSPAPSRSPWLVPLVAVAATLLLCAGLLTWYLTQDGRVVAKPRPGNTPPTNTRRGGGLAHEPAPRDAAEAGWMISSSILDFYSEETRRRHRQQVNKIADDLRPIATPFSAALTAIRRSLPVETTRDRGEPHASADRPEFAPRRHGFAILEPATLKRIPIPQPPSPAGDPWHAASNATALRPVTSQALTQHSSRWHGSLDV